MNTVSVVAGSEFSPFSSKRSALLPGFSEADIAFFEDSMPFVEGVVRVTELNDPVFVRGERVQTRIAAGDVGYQEIENLTLLAGRFMNQLDMDTAANVILASESVVEDYFETTDWNSVL